MENDSQLLDALNAIPVASLTREEWINVGMALKQGGYPASLWDEWSMNDERYRSGECEKLWDGFRGNKRPLKPGYIIKLGERFGWSRYGSGGGVLSWNDYIGVDKEPKAVENDHLDLAPVDELRTYLEALFDPEDCVGYVTNDAFQDESGKWHPRSGVYDRTAGELLRSLTKHPDALAWTVGDWDPGAGAWIRFNALDGKGVKNANVVKFKHALVESDTLPLDEQERLYRELELPIVAMVSSGGKSVHAIVRIDAHDADEYRDRVNFLYEYLDKHGATVDTQNSNPSRLSRMPGVTRNGNRQQLLAVNIGKRSWQEWKDYVDGVLDDLPSFIQLSDYYDNPPELPPELIEGVLRCGHKMLISGASKAGKSFLLAELCIAIATGGQWLGMQCRQGQVLYVNLEIDGNSAICRFLDICKVMGVGKVNLDNIRIWNIRGHAVPLDQLVPRLIRRIRDDHYAAIIIDPIYKVITGDENNASEMGYFCNQFDRICAEANCAVIYCHHHSKGAQGAKRAMDRASGSGVFARDPDAQLDLIELELTEDLKNNVRDGEASAWRVESSLREFANIKPINIWYEHPIHRIDTSGELDRLYPEGDPRNNLKRATPEEQFKYDLDLAFAECSMGQPFVDLGALAAALGRNERTVRNHLKNYSEYEVKKGVVWKKIGDFPDIPYLEENR